MNTKILTVALGLLAVAALGAPAADPDAPDPIVGLWSIAGSLSGRSDYRGTVQIRAAGDGYAVIYSAIADDKDGNVGVVQLVGVGLRKGDCLSVAWHDGHRSGVSVWEISKDAKRMAGRWTLYPGQKAGTESLKYLGKAPDPPGDADT